jgi:AcrR family transcriptional regulator
MQSVREATLELIQEHGAEEVTTNKIAERAGIGVGSLYRYYPNKMAIFTDIYNEQLAIMDQQLSEKMATVVQLETLEEGLRETIKLTLYCYQDLLSLHGTFFSSYNRYFDFTERKNPQTNMTWRNSGQQWLSNLLMHHRHRMRVKDIEETSKFLQDIGTGYLLRIIETNPDDIASDEIAERLLDLYLRYLLND